MNNDFYSNNLMGDLVGTEQEDLDRSRETITRDLEREQAGAQVDKLEEELKKLQDKMGEGCDGCHPGYFICPAHAEILRDIEDHKKLIKEIDTNYGRN